jgi:penicillin-binding protein 1A
MRKTDINKYVGTPALNGNEQHSGSGAATAKSAVKILLKAILTIVIIFAITGAIVVTSLISFIMTMRNEGSKMDLGQLKLDYTSFIYVNDKSGKPVEYQRLYSNENRVWVSFDKIPKSMKDAMVAIEDKRFYDHQGVDWFSTFGAATKLFTKGGGGGGSTLTQQLIKNITGENQVSLTRKVKEIFSAINLEKRYSKDQILEAYLNVVNYGSGCQGVQAAANLYFNKDISQCDIAQCAAIASITQSPSYYSPIISDQTRAHNKVRQQTVIQAMYDQGKISKADYDKAMAESKNMVFSTKKSDEAVDATPVQNWYMDAMFDDVVDDLIAKGVCSSKEEAESKMYHGGLKIYSAMDTQAQTYAESAAKDLSKWTSDSQIQLGFYMMDYSGRVLATVGARGEKTGNRLWSNAIDTTRQPGSSIKPISAYRTAIETGKINYSTLLEDKPIDNYFPNGSAGPNNWYKGYKGNVTANYALEISSNAVAAQICNMVTPKACYNFLTQKLKFAHLNSKTDSVEVAAMAIGGLNGGVTVKEMTAGYQMFGNGGKYFTPYTYFYVEDHDGNVILDNRKGTGSQVISSSTATILHKMMDNVIYGAEGTGTNAAISGWSVFGKTGTTDHNKDSWFVAGTPYAIAGIWTGYSTPRTLSNTTVAISVWRKIMLDYLKDKSKLNFTYDSDVIQAKFCKDSGKLAGANCTHTAIGWYKRGSLPEVCDGTHPSSSSAVDSSILPPSSANSSTASVDSSTGTTTSLPSTSSSKSNSSSSGISFGSQPSTSSLQTP